jgi:arabinogalactan endo-1,4-beta-galactosidase
MGKPDRRMVGKQDVLAKAIRANNLGMRIMIDFHYSDSWADPVSNTNRKHGKANRLQNLKPR